jgi:hypothetical protein
MLRGAAGVNSGIAILGTMPPHPENMRVSKIASKAGF